MHQLAWSADFRWTVKWVADDYDEAFMAILNDEVEQAVKELPTSR